MWKKLRALLFGAAKDVRSEHPQHVGTDCPELGLRGGFLFARLLGRVVARDSIPTAAAPWSFEPNYTQAPPRAPACSRAPSAPRTLASRSRSKSPSNDLIRASPSERQSGCCNVGPAACAHQVRPSEFSAPEYFMSAFRSRPCVVVECLTMRYLRHVLLVTRLRPALPDAPAVACDSARQRLPFRQDEEQ